MYIYTYIYIYICMYECMYVSIYLRIYIDRYIEIARKILLGLYICNRFLKNTVCCLCSY